MTSKLVLDNIAGRTTAGSITIVGEGNTTTTNLQQGLTKVWCIYDADNTSIRDSFNIASITDNANGRHEFAFSNPMNGADYVCVGTAGISGYHNISTRGEAFGTVSASAVPIRSTHTNASSDDDDGQTSFSVNGDLG
tara:strand:- start:42 stop:452 length:411 start_codon:yes stop_codon:yes gene_type:complete